MQHNYPKMALAPSESHTFDLAAIPFPISMVEVSALGRFKTEVKKKGQILRTGVARCASDLGIFDDLTADDVTLMVTNMDISRFEIYVRVTRI